MDFEFSYIHGTEVDEHQQLMESAFQLRHQIFVDEMGWEELRKPNGLEMDQFDTADALHMFLHHNGKLIGYQRMLPTTKPYLLTEVYPHLCEIEAPKSPSTWEWTRFAVLPEYRKGGRKLSYAGNLLLSGIVEWGLENDVNQIVIEMNPLWMLTLPILHFRPLPLGIPHKISDVDTIAVVANFDQRTLAQLQKVRGDSAQVLSRNRSAASG